MKTSSDRILTTHVGSLPRPDKLRELLQAQFDDDEYDQQVLAQASADAVLDIVARQVETGIDIVSDGEMSKISYTFYVKHRLNGVGIGEPLVRAPNKDLLDHPDFHDRLKAASWRPSSSDKKIAGPLSSSLACIGPISYGDKTPVERDLAHFGDAVKTSKPVDAFINAASPGVLTKFVPDSYYGNEDRYVADLADAMKIEYEAIYNAGFLLQIDCPDLGSARHNQYQDLSDAEFLRIAERNVEALNHATAAIPSEALRIHICWGNYAGPHTHDVPLATVFDTCMKANAQAFLFEGANPRHEHEWEDLAEAKIPDDKILVPGVIDSTSNFVEHPRLVAQRICRYADIVGRERVIAGTDCGFATFAGPLPQVAPSIAWAKLGSLVEGAAIASERLW